MAIEGVSPGLVTEEVTILEAARINGNEGQDGDERYRSFG